MNTPSNLYITTNLKSDFSILNVPTGDYKLTISHLGYKTIEPSIEVDSTNKTFSYTLQTDLINLHTVVVTATFNPRTQIESNTSISTLNTKDIQQVYPQGTANLLQNIPGTFVHASTGEVFTRVYTRGISAAAEDNMGWYYASLKEDGLPVSLLQHSYYASDLFHRTDY